MTRSSRYLLLALLWLPCVCAMASGTQQVDGYGQRLAPPDAPQSSFGQLPAAVSGDWVAVTATSGVYLFRRQTDTGVWMFSQKIELADGGNGVAAVVLTGSQLFVASPGAYDASRQSYSGAVYAYTLRKSLWEEDYTLYSHSPLLNAGSGFGEALALGGGTLYVGFPGAMLPNGMAAGAVEAYDVATPGSYLGRVAPPRPQSGMRFGSALAASNGVLAVGADNEAAGGAAMGMGVGAVHVFWHVGSRWAPIANLGVKSPQMWDYFPNAIAMDGWNVVAADVDYNETGKGEPFGEVFSYSMLGPRSSFQVDPDIDDNYAFNQFGEGITVAKNILLVGAPGTGATGQVFAYTASTRSSWRMMCSMALSGLQNGDAFGTSLVTDGKTLVVGAMENSHGQDAGTVYVFDYLAVTSPTPSCH